MQVIVEPLHLGQNHAQETRAWRHAANSCRFHRLTISQRVRNAADARDALGQHHAAFGAKPLEALLHAAMLEEQPRVIMQDRLAEVVEQKLGGFDHVGAHWAERQQLHIGLVAGKLRDRLRGRFDAQRQVGGIVRIEWRAGRLDALVQDQTLRLRMIDKA
jgi:hypothetical protein